MFPPLRAASAQKAYAKLCALDVYTPEKTELVAAGVPSAAISALYPESEIEVIERALAARLPQLPSSTLEARIQRCLRATQPLEGAITRDIYVAAMGFEDRGDATGDRMIPIFEAAVESHRPALNPFLADRAADNLANGIWWAWWSMRYRSGLPFSLRMKADVLMLAVANTFELA